MLYVDQPIGTGFSYGVNNADSTVEAAKNMWTFLQSLYAAFLECKGCEFGLFSESYGGCYGPAFVDHFQGQNAVIDAGKIMGDRINVVALGINNAWVDSARI
jgi:carboxypeptidase C (cathepsin A)